jgi:hypothetical protein
MEGLAGGIALLMLFFIVPIFEIIIKYIFKNK